MHPVGSNLTPVPKDCCVLRLAQLPKDFAEKANISAIQLDLSNEFTLSSDDKDSVPPHLSVWVEALTKPEQAYRFLADNSPRKLVLRLKVNQICEIKGNSGEGVYSNLLDVIWVYLFDESNERRVRDSRLGADGHSGITGLDEKSVPQGLTNRQQKNLRKDLRAQLAELASKDKFLLTKI
ncbi:hypothetical protein PN499_03060 [Kamptonema animale CS-326]|jgi:hypothetical protein|uniref:hypothetical protein n=1 Tax=Kamptonema animale TaxID=92934 RepID=UPI00232E2311|nr:hypothetical protein [Kamptonema animale]MDB9510189.1 hypothetical protein [Kamptonema animale CS-326]